MRLTSVLPRLRLRSLSYVIYVAVLLTLIGSILALDSLHKRYQRGIAQAIELARRFSMVHGQIESTILESRSSLFAYLQVGTPESLDAYQRTYDHFFELSVQLTALADQIADEGFWGRVAKVRQLDGRWRKEFADAAVASRQANGSPPVSPELLQVGMRLADELDTEVKALRAHGSTQWAQVQQDLQTAADRQRFGLLTITAAVLIGAGAFLIWLTRNVETPLAELNRLTRLVVRGGRFQFSRKAIFAELRQLFENCAAMVHSLRERESQLLASQANTARTNQDLATITDYAKYLHQVSNEEEIARALVEQARRLINVRQIGFYLRHRSHPEYELIFAHPPVKEGEPAFRPTLKPSECSVLRNGQTLRVLDRRSELSASCQHQCQQYRSELCVPVSAGGSVLGVLHLANESAVEWSAETVELVTSLANFTGPAISTLRSLENMWERATRDPLTMLYNRRYLEEHLPLAVESAKRDRCNLGVLIFDIDFFKAVNDTHGHDTGDRVICRVARAAKQTVRSSDVVCRFGGEEFVVILPKTDEKGSTIIAEKLRTRIAEDNPGSEPHVTVSVGMAIFPQHGESHDVLLKAADLALYRAKAGGRNRVELFNQHDATRKPAKYKVEATG